MSTPMKLLSLNCCIMWVESIRRAVKAGVNYGLSKIDARCCSTQAGDFEAGLVLERFCREGHCHQQADPCGNCGQLPGVSHEGGRPVRVMDLCWF